MAQKKDQFSKGDWIVHLHYGVGQVKNIERKQIADEKSSYYRVETAISTFWVPVESPDAERVRSVASKYLMRKALGIMREKPNVMADDHNERKRQINEAMTQISLNTSAAFIRDISAHQMVKKLNPSEEKALDQFAQNLILEWSISMDMDIEKVRDKFQGIVQEIHDNAPQPNK